MHLIRPFKKEDLDKFEPIEPVDGKDTIREMGQMIEDSGLAVTGIKDGKVVGCGGVHPWGEIWLRISGECRKFPIETARCLKEAVGIIEKTFGFRQLYAVIQDRFCPGKKLIERCGYKPIQYKTENGIKYIVYTKLIWAD